MSSAMRVGVIGTGYVGLVTATCLAEAGHHLTCVDNDPRKIQTLREGKIPIYEPGLEEMVARNVAAGRMRFSGSTAEAAAENEMLFIAVGTPGRDDGTADLSFIEAVSREIATNLPADGTRKIIVEKSTVPVSTGDRVKRSIQRGCRPGVQFEVVSNPEFLREGSAIHDFFRPDRIVVGVESEFAAAAMRRLYEPILEGRYFDPPGSRRPAWLVTDVASAELIKHASNSFLALKISYINSIAAICELTGGNIEHVAEGMGLDNRIGPQFLRAGLGYGGSCFPKDVAAFREIARAGVAYCASPYQAAEQADALLVVTEWDEFRYLDLKRLRETMKHGIIIDGRNIFDPPAVTEAGFEYFSMGRPPVRPAGMEQSSGSSVS